MGADLRLPLTQARLGVSLPPAGSSKVSSCSAEVVMKVAQFTVLRSVCLGVWARWWEVSAPVVGRGSGHEIKRCLDQRKR